MYIQTQPHLEDLSTGTDKDANIWAHKWRDNSMTFRFTQLKNLVRNNNAPFTHYKWFLFGFQYVLYIYYYLGGINTENWERISRCTECKYIHYVKSDTMKDD